MFDVTHTIRDAQYRFALDNIEDSVQDEPFLKPTEAQLAKYVNKLPKSFDFVLETPIAAYMFKKYLQKFLSLTVVLEFLVHYHEMSKIEQVTENHFERLIVLCKSLPAPYRHSVLKIKKSISKLKNYDMHSIPSRTLERDIKDIIDRGLLKPDTQRHLRNLAIPEDNVSLISRSRIEFALKDSYLERSGLMSEMTLSDVDSEADTPSVTPFEKDSCLQDTCSILLLLCSNLQKKLLGKLKALYVTFEKSPEYSEMTELLWFQKRAPVSEDFRKFRTLGKGAFGAVSGVKHKHTGQFMAMKMMSKKLIKGKKALRLVKEEKSVLQILGDSPSPFTIWLKYAFQDKDYFYMAIPLCTGGDLEYHLGHTASFSVERARLYAAEIFEGLSHMHNLGILYRDLKPENVILDAKGHCRISDMGLAVVTNGRRIQSLAGTPGYWAPEVMIKSLFYGYPADYWSFGAVVFEMLIGICPFSKTNTGMLRDRATREWRIKYPKTYFCGETQSEEDFPDDLKAFLKGLLKRRASKRFNERAIRQHRFFSKYKWADVRAGRLKPSFIPTKSKVNAAKAAKLDKAKIEAAYKKITLTAEDNVPNFEYVSKTAHALDIINVLERKKEQEEIYLDQSIIFDRSFVKTKPRTKMKREKSTNFLKRSSTRNRREKKGDCSVM